MFVDEEMDKMHQSPTVQLARQVGSPPHKVQLMKASFFMDEDEDLESGKKIISSPFSTCKNTVFIRLCIIYAPQILSFFFLRIYIIFS